MRAFWLLLLVGACGGPHAKYPSASTHISWFVEYELADKITSHDIGAEAGTVPLVPGTTEAQCKYDAASTDAQGYEFRWLRCFGAHWRAQTLVECETRDHTHDRVEPDGSQNRTLKSSYSVLLMAGTDDKQFGVSIGCTAQPKSPEN